MLHRLLLAAAGGSGSFPRPTQTFTITDAPQGAWPWGNAHHYGDYTYIAYTNNAGGIRVAIVEDGTQTDVAPVASYIEADAFAAPDQHNSPAIWQRSDGKLLAMYMPHAGPNVYRRVTVNSLASDPTISGGWAARADMDSSIGGTAYTYPNVHTFAAGPVMFYRDQDGVNNWEISQSTDNGATWGAFTNLFWAARAYGRSFGTSTSRLDILCTDGSYAEDFASIYHFYVESGNPFQTDGTPIAGGFPVDFADMTLIYDGATAGARLPSDIVVLGGEIAAVWAVQTGTPHDHIGEDVDYMYARWDGAAWSTSTVASAIGGLTLDFTEGGLVIDPTDLDHLLVSRREVSDLAYPFRVFEVRSSDGGATWPAGHAVSVEDGNSAIYPTFVRDAGATVIAVWLQGPNLTSQSDFSTGIEGWGV